MDETNTQALIEKEINKRRQEVTDDIKKTFNHIFHTPKQMLTKEDIGFLQARRAYLTESEQKEYADILSVKLTELTLDDMVRKDLEAKALELGIENPDKLPNRQAIIDAIRAVQN